MTGGTLITKLKSKNRLMKQHTKRFATALAMAIGLIVAGSAQAQYTTTTISDFHNFNLGTLYANWGSGWAYSQPVITSGPLSYEINAAGYGSGTTYPNPVSVSAPGATEVQLTFTVNNIFDSSNVPANGDYFFGANFDLTDSHNTSAFYAGYAHYVGQNTFTVTDPIGSIDPSSITAFNLELDPGNIGNNVYDISYDGLALLTPVPEPTTLALLATGAVGLVIARRRFNLG
jgi:hypothetical protein